ncbi:hypothetical protein D9M69_532190 [compost metagenome]
MGVNRAEGCVLRAIGIMNSLTGESLPGSALVDRLLEARREIDGALGAISEDAEGWVPLDGSCQIPGWMDVEVRRGDGSISVGRASELSWDGVMAFRVAAEASS